MTTMIMDLRLTQARLRLEVGLDRCLSTAIERHQGTHIAESP